MKKNVAHRNKLFDLGWVKLQKKSTFEAGLKCGMLLEVVVGTLG